MSRSRPYHHGDLPAALLLAVDEIVRQEGVGAVSLRRAARHAGVSHAAPAHHFGDKAGLLTAFAVEGFVLLRGHLVRGVGAMKRSGEPDFKQCGIAYVEFATNHPAHFAVMFRPEHLRTKDRDYQRETLTTYGVLLDGIREIRDDLNTDDPVIFAAAAGAWSMSHGFATLWLEGELSRLYSGRTAEAVAAEAFDAFMTTLLRPSRSAEP